MLDGLHAYLGGTVLILGIGNTLKSDDAAGSIIAARIAGKTPYKVYDAGTSPENYLGKVIKDRPDNIIIIDAADFGGTPGQMRLMEGGAVRTANMFSTHNASISLTIDYLLNSLKNVNIAVLLIQPRTLAFGQNLSPEVSSAVDVIADWFLKNAQNKDS